MQYSFPADIWMLGVLYQIMSLQPPWINKGAKTCAISCTAFVPQVDTAPLELSTLATSADFSCGCLKRFRRAGRPHSRRSSSSICSSTSERLSSTRRKCGSIDSRDFATRLVVAAQSHRAPYMHRPHHRLTFQCRHTSRRTYRHRRTSNEHHRTRYQECARQPRTFRARIRGRHRHLRPLLLLRNQ